MVEGERQVAPTLAGIRRDHVARYEFAARAIGRSKRVLDVACGVGYGAQVLARAGHRVLGIDRDPEAILYGRMHYPWPGVRLKIGEAARLRAKGYQAAVCFETIEHLADPLPMLRALRRAAPVLVASVPNEAVFAHGGRMMFHHRHYTRAELEALLARAGFRVTGWFGQAGPESEVEPEVEGRTLVVIARRAAPREPAPAPTLKVAPPPAPPKHVAIVGLGPSAASFYELTRRLGGSSAYCDEVWGINAQGDVLRCDRVFHMDDVRIQEIRAAARPDSNIAGMLGWLRRHPGPVYTSVAREDYPGLTAFPLQDVLNGGYDTNGGSPYFNSTAAYAIAFAVHLGVQRISCFGLDYTLANAHHAEKGRACCEFWLGIAAARGIEIAVPDTSTLLDACDPPEERLYGYDCVEVGLRDVAGGVEVHFAPRDKLPTAAEIEARYDHSKHPSSLVRKGVS